MSDEDFEPFVGGPPPDPSERSWRHPSEVAAQAQAESMGSSRRTARGPRALLGWRPDSTANLVVAGSLGAAACVAGIAVIQSMSAVGTSATEPFDVAASVGVIAETAEMVDTGDQPSPITSVTQVAARPTTTAPAPIPDVVVEAAEAHLVPISVGVATIANGVLLDGYLITAAGSVGNQLSVTYGHGDDDLVAYLVGVDPFSDLAVFRPSNESRAGRTLQALSTSLNAAPELPPSGIDNDDPVTVVGFTDQGLEASPGMVIATDSNATDRRGHPLIGLIDTSARQPTRSGAMLVSNDGRLAGIVIGTSSSLASAVPVDAALAIAERLTQRGWANETWIGFVGIDHDDGVEVVDVTESGPAHAAGLRPGDMIYLFDGAPIEHMGGVTAGLRRASPGDTIVLVVERLDQLLTLRIEAVAYSPDPVTEPADG